MAEAKVTTDHAKIRSWVEARGGRPKRVKGTARNDGSGSVCIAYPGMRTSEPLESIAWADWFRAFDDNKLAFLYDDSLRSRDSKLVSRAKVATPRRAGAAKRTTAKRTVAKRGTAKAKAKARGGKLTPVVAEKAASTRKAPRAMAARIAKRPASAKKRSATKKPAAGAKRTPRTKRAGAKRASAKRASTKR